LPSTGGASLEHFSFRGEILGEVGAEEDAEEAEGVGF